MDQLLEGYRHFRATEWPAHQALFEALALKGQHPRALVITCSDSRIDPSMIFGAEPGELFTIRNVANLVPEYHPDSNFHCTSAAVEYAIRVLQVPDVIVLGHAECGGIKALMGDAPEVACDFVPQWMRIAEPAKRRALLCDAADKQTACEEEAIKMSIENLMTFPWIADRVATAALRIHGATFDIRSGVLAMMNEGGVFAPM